MNRTHALSVGVSLGAVALVLVQVSPLVVSGQIAALSALLAAL